MTSAYNPALSRMDKEVHPTVDGAWICVIEQEVGKRKEARLLRQAWITYPDGGYIVVTANPKTKHLGISSFYNSAARLDDMNALIAEQQEWLDAPNRAIDFELKEAA